MFAVDVRLRLRLRLRLRSVCVTAVARLLQYHRPLDGFNQASQEAKVWRSGRVCTTTHATRIRGRASRLGKRWEALAARWPERGWGRWRARSGRSWAESRER